MLISEAEKLLAHIKSEIGDAELSVLVDGYGYIDEINIVKGEGFDGAVITFEENVYDYIDDDGESDE